MRGLVVDEMEGSGHVRGGGNVGLKGGLVIMSYIYLSRDRFWLVGSNISSSQA